MINEKRFIFIVSISLILLFILKTILHGENKIIIKLKDVSYVKSDQVKLKDIALVVGDEKIKNIKITTSPSAGQFIFINRNFIKNIVQAHTNKNFKIFGSENIKIVRQSFVYSKTLIEKLINNFLNAHSKEIFKGAKWNITKIISPPKVLLPYENCDVKITCDNEHISNRIVLNVTFLKNSIPIKRINVITFFRIYKKVIVANQDIYPRKIITPDLISIKEMGIKNFNLNYVENPNFVIGKQSTRYIRRGEILTTNMVKIPPAVKRGSIVKVIASDGSIVITTLGKALENGVLNSSIRVMNLSSGKTFIAKICAPGEVIVRF